MLHTKGDFRKARGFTIVELVVSLAIISLVLASAFHLFDNSIRLYENLNSKLYVHQNVRQSLLWLTSKIRQAKEVRVIGQDKIEIRKYRGGDIISFYLKDQQLFREKNKGTNPVANLNRLRFSTPLDVNYVEIELGCAKGNYNLDIKTRVTPMGSIASK